MFEDFEFFNNTSCMRCVDYITIAKTGIIIFPKAMLRKNHLEDKKAVKLFYNKKTKQVAFLFEDEAEKGSYKIKGKCYGNSTSSVITAKTFLKFYGIKAEETTRYPYKKQTIMSSGEDHSLVEVLVIDVEEV